MDHPTHYLARKFPDAQEALAVYIRFVRQCQCPEIGAYRERHHILPRSIFPEHADAPWNLRELSGADHFKAHYLLFKALPNVPQAVYAWRMLWANRFKQLPIEMLEAYAEEYATAKAAWSRLRRAWSPTPETRAKMSASAKVKVFSETHRANMSRSKMGHVVTEETKRKIGDAQRGIPRGPRDPDAVKATADKLRGRKQTPEQVRAAQEGRARRGPRVVSEETKRKMREAAAIRWAKPESRESARQAAKNRKRPTPPPPSDGEV